MGRPPSTWKKVERRIARFWGGERNPLSGGNGKHTRSDSLSKQYFIEAKHGLAAQMTWPAIERLFVRTEQLAEAEGKLAILVLHPRGGWGGPEEYDTYLRVGVNGSSFIACLPGRVAKTVAESAHAARMHGGESGALRSEKPCAGNVGRGRADGEEGGG